MFAVIGLGNPGEKYAHTRHNVGQVVLDFFLREHQFGALKKDSSVNASSTWKEVYGERIEVLFPLVYMNLSGGVVKNVIQKREVEPQHIIVVHDDVHLPFGSVRVSFGRGEGGHNGVASITQALKTKAFVRIRVGVAQKSFFGGVKKHTGSGLSQFVLRDFTSREVQKLPEIGEKVTEAIRLTVTDGVERAMQECNL